MDQLAELVTKGTTPTTLGFSFVDEGVNFVKVESISADGSLRENLFSKITTECHDALTRSQLRAGDLLFSIAGALGRSALVPRSILPANTNQAVAIIRLKSGIEVDRQFLLYALSPSLIGDQIAKFRGGVAQQNLSLAQIRALVVPVPPLEVQKRIVAVLDEAFEGLSRARANAEANLKDAGKIVLGHLQGLFADCERRYALRRIGDIADHCLGKMLDKNKNQGSLSPYLRNINVRWFEIDTSDMLEMRIEDREVERYSAQRGDLLICEGGYPGRAAVWVKEEPAFFQKALHRVRFRHSEHAEFLMYYLYMMDATGQLRSHFTGAGIQHFTGQALARFQMPFPEIDTATKVVAQIREVQSFARSLEHQYQSTLSDLDALRHSLLQKAFSGELT